jgi:hypothetical protein
VNTQTPLTHHHKCDDETACADCASGARNRFFKGKRMRADDFRLEQAYGLARRRLINRAVLGWGVVRGLSLGTEPSFEIGAGFALDRHGRELLVVEPIKANQKNTFLGDPDHSIGSIAETTKEDAQTYLLRAHYAERRFGDVPELDACGCEPPEKNFTCETVVFSLTAVKDGRCPCEDADCHRKCECRDPGDTSDASGKPSTAVEPGVAQQSATQTPYRHGPPPAPRDRTCGEKGRGPHECLCQWVTSAAEPEESAALRRWRDYCVAVADGVALGCVKAWKQPPADPKRNPTSEPDCEVIVIEPADGCGPRRLVKNNDLLYDLIRGCDLTRISKTSWQEWHRSSVEMPWETFFDMFFETPLKTGEEPREVPTKFVITFSDKIRRDTLRRDAVIMTAITVEKNSNWRVTKRVPIAKLDSAPSAESKSADPDLTDQVRIVVYYDWIQDELLRGSGSDLAIEDFVIEIEVRGDLITDCHGQSVDANASGRHAVPSGNGTPGGTYVSSFPVTGKPDNPKRGGL